MGRKKKSETIANDIQKEAESIIQNGLGEALLGSNPFDQSTQISQVDTLQKNNRWYLISNFRQLLSQIYVEHGLIQTIVDLPVDDGIGRGFEIITDELSQEDIEDLLSEMDFNNDLDILCEALKWNRLFGGAGVLIITNQPPETELNIDSIKKGEKVEFRSVDMWELFYDLNVSDDYALNIDQRLGDQEFFNYYGKKIHHSRVLLLKGKRAPSFIRPRLRGWGLSVVETFVRSINQYLKSTDLTFDILDEFKIDIYKIKGLTNALMSPQGIEQIQKRVDIANRQKNYQHAISMDSEDEYQQKQLTFTGIAETQAGIRMQVASDLRMPLSKLFGISSSGFNSGEDDIENYNSMIESEIRSKAKYHLLKIIRIRCLQKFGFYPESLKVKFPSLRILDSEQEENVKTSKFNRLIQTRQAGEITEKEFIDACNKDNLLSIHMDREED